MNKFECIFFIDDDEAINFYHEIIAKDSGIVKEVIQFHSSVVALKYFEEKRFTAIPEVIFLDLNMPELNGLEFLSLFNQLNLNIDPKIILFSTAFNPNDTKMLYEHPLIMECITKPITEDYLKELINKISPQ